ncbi:hypothetical protein A3715_16470 [Oleiphilus sp. HI0009]|nr:DNA polymerase III subunit gamma/tau [Oleiphilus sp. HI0067]KZX86199.1 hypothetical protein A3715_16470 [Oleiphilus sp. HI0009]KZY68967.1 hypothetical protein A3739_09845 [Oleiphilus sp. HI0067]
MSYQVLARKWRPKNFKQMVGQEHVLQALIHALESQRLHHAYLFTGTRGVGKTTIARILARCLSCERGITSEPCGECGACTSIEQGRYVDLIEIDAASRTKVEDMRGLLENVQYAPTEGRFKIYLIDEVHMLSTHSFNALLKTLEEPPEHVKFLFATTDPQKLPITILSRCLQFNLKNMTPERIVHHLKFVLSQEQVSAEDAALWAIARGADGSMRDALSLTDQAIAYTQGQLGETAVSAMLGTVDQKKVYRLLDMLVARDAKAMLGVVAELAEFAPDYASVLEVLVSVFHRVAIEQAVAGATDNSQGDQERITFYAQNLSAEDVQLYYQIALVARKDLAISPDARSGFEMALLRMMAFCMAPPTKPVTQALAPEVSTTHAPPAHEVQGEVETASSEADVSDQTSVQPEPLTVNSEVAEMQQESEQTSESQIEPQNDVAAAPVEQVPAYMNEAPPLQDEHPAPAIDNQQSLVEEPVEAMIEAAPMPSEINSTVDTQANESQKKTPKFDDSQDLDSMSWPRQAIRLGLTGMTQNLLMNMVKRIHGEVMELAVETGHFRILNDTHKKKIVQALKDALAWNGAIEFKDGVDAGQETPAMWRERMREEQLIEAKQKLHADENVKQLIAEFDGRLIEDSVVALGTIE